MLKNYMVKYWTTEGRLAGLQVSALSPMDAQEYVKDLPNFQTLANYPQEV